MPTKASRRRHKPALPDPAPGQRLALSDMEPRSLTVKLSGEEGRALDRVRQLLAGPEGAHYPSISHAVRLAIACLYHSLTGHPPSESNGRTT
jgi:hypothetical protein